MAAGPSLGGRALLALALLCLFYVLALSICAGLVWLPLALGVGVNALVIKLAIPCWIGAAIVLWSLVPRLDRFPAPGPRLTPPAQPALFEEIGEVARATGQPPPDEVYLVGDVNAFVAQRGGWMGIGSRRVMGLGLPLLASTSRAELRGVIAHEFGHFTGGDTRLGPWIYKTRDSLARTLNNLDKGDETLEGSFLLRLVRKPFHAYMLLFLRVTQAISRAQELAADRLGARVVGPRAMCTSLERVGRTALGFELYMRGEFVPVLSQGHRPPFAAGFVEFLGASPVQAQLDLILADAPQAEPDPFDSHPPATERVRALQDLPPVALAPELEQGALGLLRDLPAAEAELVSFMTGDAKFEALEWDDVPERVLRPDWERACAAHGEKLAGLTLPELSAHAGKPAIFAHWMGLPPAAEPELAQSGRALLVRALALALVRAGWQLRSRPGQPIELERAGETLRPVELLADFAEGRRDAESWRAWCAQAGVGELRLWPDAPASV